MELPKIDIDVTGAEQSRLALQASQEEKAALQRDYDQAAQALEQMREEAAQRLQEAEAAEERELQARREATEAQKTAEAWKRYATDLAAYEALTKWQRWRQKVQKPVPPALQEVEQEEEHGTAED